MKKKQGQITQTDYAVMALEKLGGCAQMKDICILAKAYIGEDSSAEKVENNVRRVIYTHPKLFSRVEGKDEGWWQLNTHRDEIASLKSQIAERDGVIERYKNIRTEDDFIKMLMPELMEAYKYERKALNPFRLILRNKGYDSAAKVLDAFIKEKDEELAKALQKLADKPSVHVEVKAGAQAQISKEGITNLLPKDQDNNEHQD